jgi:hypothetical protein
MQKTSRNEGRKKEVQQKKDMTAYGDKTTGPAFRGRKRGIGRGGE